MPSSRESAQDGASHRNRSKRPVYVLLVAVALAGIGIGVLFCSPSSKPSSQTQAQEVKDASQHPYYRQMEVHPWWHYDSSLGPGEKNDTLSWDWSDVPHEYVFIVPKATRKEAVCLLRDRPIVKLSVEDAKSLLAGAEWEEMTASMKPEEWGLQEHALSPPRKFLEFAGYSPYLVRGVSILPPPDSYCPDVRQKGGIVLVRFTMSSPKYFTKPQEWPLVLVLKEPPTEVYHDSIWSTGIDYTYTEPCPPSSP